MTQKLLDRFSQNSTERLHTSRHGRNRQILAVIRITLRLRVTVGSGFLLSRIQFQGV